MADIKKILSKMSVHEKVCQLMQIDGHNFVDTKSSLSALTKDFKTILPSFKTGLLNISVLMTYLVDDLPFASFLITASLLIGLISFMFNIAGSLVGAASSSRRDTSNSKEGS